MKITFYIFLTIGIFICCINAQAQERMKDGTSDNENSAVEKFKRSLQYRELKDERSKDVDVLLHQTEVIENELSKYEISVYQHRRKVFEWQYISGIVIFWLVLLIVLLGLLFSGVQFYIGWKEKGAGPNFDGNKDDTSKLKSNSTESVTEFEASLRGIKVRSSVIGIIILVISLGFFYLYLVHVYPVKVIGPSGGNIMTEKK